MCKSKKIILILGFFLLITQNLFATITYSPSQPNVEQQVTFTVTHPDGIGGNQVQWDFGDGTPIMQGPPTVIKIYKVTGTYTVKASYWTYKQQYITDQTTITIIEKRKITYTPLKPKAGEIITFRAENFLSFNIKWDFGDGTIINCNSPLETHIYENPGTYLVKAWDWCGNSVATISASIIVLPAEVKGPRAPFSISFINLRFSDGKSYKVVPKDFESLIAYADIKYEGTGILNAQWLVDGKPFKILTKALPYAQQAIIDSGNVPGLPTQIPGIHEVSLKIIQPQTEYSIPVIRYFVSPARVKREKVNLSVSKALNLNEIEIPINTDSIKVPARDYFLLKGIIKNENETLIPYVLLRIYLGNELIDQQLIKNLKPKSEVEFETSIYNSSSESKTIYITLYNISRKPANLIFIKKLKIVIK